MGVALDLGVYVLGYPMIVEAMTENDRRKLFDSHEHVIEKVNRRLAEWQIIDPITAERKTSPVFVVRELEKRYRALMEMSRLTEMASQHLQPDGFHLQIPLRTMAVRLRWMAEELGREAVVNEPEYPTRFIAAGFLPGGVQ